MSEETEASRATLTSWLRGASPTTFSTYCIVAAFSTYFCMYAFRKPFTAAEYGEIELFNVGYKTVLIAAQVAGYTLSKFIGIKVISEMPPGRRAVAILGLIGLAELSLLLFAITPPPYGFPLLFLNGLPLGMVFGLVLSFLEGRRVTEALSAGLCASFILSSGVVKSVGRWLIVGLGVPEYWMPFLTGLLFMPPLLVSVYLLSRIPAPDEADVAVRSRRVPMTPNDRCSLFRRHAFGLSGLVLIYMLLTVIRSMRDDFAVEIWADLGHSGEPSVFAYSELAVMLGVTLVNGASVLVHDNRKAFLASFGLLLIGFAILRASLWAQSAGAVSPFAFMVLVGLGAYIPYVAFHTTVFERLLATFHERGNIGYLMYLADAMGYLTYVFLMVAKNFLPDDIDHLTAFTACTSAATWCALGLTASVALLYARRTPD